MGANNPHLGFAMTRVATMGVGALGSRRDMEVPPGFEPHPWHGTPLAAQPPRVGPS
jgi:hypothetical protein